MNWGRGVLKGSCHIQDSRRVIKCRRHRPRGGFSGFKGNYQIQAPLTVWRFLGHFFTILFGRPADHRRVFTTIFGVTNSSLVLRGALACLGASIERLAGRLSLRLTGA
ncbi:uncharacterized protein ACBT44_021102 isoform 4-T6 [Syngnathus typhle]